MAARSKRATFEQTFQKQLHNSKSNYYIEGMSVSESDIIRVKFLRFINTFRTEASKLNDEERKHIGNLDDFFPPCQLMLLKFGTLAQKYLLVTHDENREDCEIDIYSIQTWDAVDELEKIRNDPRWNRELPDEEKQIDWRVSNYSEIIERQLIHIFQRMETSIFVKPSDRFKDLQLLVYERDFLWVIHNIDLFDPDDQAREITEQAKRQYEVEKNKEQPTPPKQKISSPESLKGFGTYFFPPIRISEYPELSFREKIRGPRVSTHFFRKSITDNYRGLTIIIEENGYIGICEESKRLANTYLNEIMGTGLLFGFHFFSVRDGDLSEINVNPTTLRIGSRDIIPRGSVLRQFDRKELSWNPDIRPSFSIKPEGLSLLLDISEMINNEPEITDCLVLLVESFTCMQSSQFIQSFIVSWTIIEKYLYWIWESHLRKKSINYERRKKLTDGSDWNVAKVIEMLDVEGVINREDYKILTDLRKKRNDLIHEGEIISQEDALKCFDYSFNIMQARTNALKIYSEDSLTKYIIKKYDPYDF